MRKCADCGLCFEESNSCWEYLGECHGHPIYEDKECCPACASSEYAEAKNSWDCSAIF